MTDLADANERLTRLLGPLWNGELTEHALDAALGGATLAEVWAACNAPQPLVRLVGGLATRAELAHAALACACLAAEDGPVAISRAIGELAPYVARVDELREVSIRPALAVLEDALGAAVLTDRDLPRLEAVLALLHLVRDDRESEAWNAAAQVASHAHAACPGRGADLARAARDHLRCPTAADLLGPDPRWGKRGTTRRTGRTRLKPR